MRHLNKLLLGSGVCILAAMHHSGATAADMADLMTADQFRAYGLHKLSAEEQAALYQWLQSYSGKQAVTPAVPAPEPTNSSAVTVTATPAAVESMPEGKQLSAADSENFGFPTPLPETSADAYKLEARVVGRFRGWNGKTVFNLDNGQVWRQRASGKYTYTGDDTRVVISQNRWGFYDLRLVAADRSVGVSRVK